MERYYLRSVRYDIDIYINKRLNRKISLYERLSFKNGTYRPIYYSIIVLFIIDLFRHIRIFLILLVEIMKVGRL